MVTLPYGCNDTVRRLEKIEGGHIFEVYSMYGVEPSSCTQVCGV
jgi:hypothetical protein